MEMSLVFPFCVPVAAGIVCVYMGNPVLKEQPHRRLSRVLLSSGAIFPSKNPCENFGTPEPAMSPVVPYFPYPQNFRGHYSEKCGTGPELLNDGRRERMRSDIAMLRSPKAGGDEVWDAAGTRSSPGTSGIMRNYHEKPMVIHHVCLSP